jgi:hypothetical protein
MRQAAFAYAQVRLQSRHGARPAAIDWRRLEGVGNVVHFLQVARRTRLRRWVDELHGAQDSHAVELALRRQFCDYVDEVARWLPRPWRDTLGWLRRLVYLPAIQYLASGEPPQPWMLKDSRLAPFTLADREARLVALKASDCSPLVAAYERGEPIVGAWLRHWRKTWPEDAAGRQGLEQLVRMLRRCYQSADAANVADLRREYDTLLVQLTMLFRRESFRPAACYAHLGLTALDLLRLRAQLLERILLPAAEGAAQ